VLRNSTDAALLQVSLPALVVGRRHSSRCASRCQGISKVRDCLQELQVPSRFRQLGKKGGLGDHAAATAIGYLAFRAIALLYLRLRHREGLGEGDAKLLAAGGAWLGVAAAASGTAKTEEAA
jgi:hypothetical protein